MTFTHTGLRAENELLLCCARTHVNAEALERLRVLIRQDLDWQYLTRTAVTHGVAPLLYTSLYATCPEAVPGTMLDQLRDLCRANVQQSFLLAAELVKLLNLFESHGIPGLPYKGPVLAATAYGDLSLRQFSDLDIVVRKPNIVKAKDLLLSQRYRLVRPMTAAQEAAHLQSYHAYTLVRDDGRVTVDLHWRFAQGHYSFQLDPERLWERLERVTLPGKTVLNLPPEDLILILCVHGTKDAWQKLKLICDIAELIRVYHGLDWGRVIEQAGRLHSQRKLLLGLLLANSLLGAALPEKVLGRAQGDSVATSLAASVREKLFSEVDGVANTFQRIAFHLRVTERLQDKGTYFLYTFGRLMTPNAIDRAFLPLPSPLSFLYYLSRPIRLIREEGLKLLKRLLKHPRAGLKT